MKIKKWMAHCGKVVEKICERDEWHRAEIKEYINREVPKEYRLGTYIGHIIKAMGYDYIKKEKIFVRRKEDDEIHNN